MKHTKIAISVGIIASSILLWTSCNTGSGSGDNSGNTAPATTIIPTMSNLAGSWTGKASDTTDEGGTSTETWTYTFNSDGTYTELENYTVDNPGTDSDEAETEAYKGTMSLSSDGILSLTATKYYSTEKQAISDISAIPAWGTPSSTMKQIKNIAIIDGSLYFAVYIRANEGSGLVGTWKNDGTGYSGTVSSNTFVFTASTWTKNSTKDGTTSTSSGTYTISDGKMHATQNGTEVFSGEYIVTDKYWVQEKSRGFTKKS